MMLAKNKHISFSVLGLSLWAYVAWLFLARPLFIIEILPSLIPLSVLAFLLFATGLLILCGVATSTLRNRAPYEARKVIFLSALILVLYNLSPLAPAWTCFGNRIYVKYANAAGQNCTTTCTNNDQKPCGGWSSCWDKYVSCSSDGKDQDGRDCDGCCFSCKVVCEDPDPPLAQPPTITGTVSCSQAGINGWCTGTSTLNLIASDPQNYALTISGSINGTAFTCATGKTCSIYLPEGNGSITYKVTAATSGLSSGTGSRTWKRDVTVPNATAVYPTANGANNWHTTSPISVSTSGSDSLAGLAGTAVSVNGGAWLPTAFLPDGTYSVNFRATDYAGNSTTVNRTIKVDSTAPAVNPIVPAPDGQNGWFISAPVELSVEGSDTGSGLASTLIQADGGVWQPTMSLSDGVHTVSFTSTDKAGNTATATRTIKVDASLPEIDALISGTEGEAGWYISPTYTTISATELSGIEHVEYNQNDSGWQTGTLIESGEGVNTVVIRAYDVAGNLATESISIKIDTVPPTIATSTEGTLGLSNWYVSRAETSISASDETSGVSRIEHTQNAADWQNGSTIISTDGSNTINIRVSDVAGNASEKSLQVNVDTIAPSVTAVIPAPDGRNNWFVTGPVRASAEGEDWGSGLAATSVASSNGIWQPSISLSDGIHSVDFKAVDNAGNSAVVSRAVKIDTVAPSLSTSTTGTPGNSGWYVSQTNTTILATDDTSGVAAKQFNQNRNGWEQGDSVLSLDGINSISIQAFDLAGNRATTSLAIKIDTEKPVSRFTSPPNESTGTLVRGRYSLAGISSDTTSGVAVAEISFDGKSWFPMPVSASNSWIYDWDSTTWADGHYPVSVRTTDVAGNKELVGMGATVTLVVNNTPPHIDLTPEWFIWQFGSLIIKTDYFPVRDGMIVIQDPQMRWPKIEVPFGAMYPAEIRWDRQFANGILAPSGDYRVTVSACNVHDLCSEKSAVIRIPWYAVALPPSPVPTKMAEVEPEIPQVKDPNKPSISTVPEFPVADTELPVEIKTNESAGYTLLSTMVVVALMWAVASAALADKRPTAIRAIAKTINSQY